MPAPFRIALTGGIGSGKTTIADQFSALGVPVIDSDIIARNSVKPGELAFKKIIDEFDPEIITENGKLNREKLREIVFADDAARLQLENILHPIIYQEVDRQIALIQYPYCIIVIPLLIETGAMHRFDRILLIDVPENIQIERASSRDGSSAELIRDIMKTQANRNQRLKYADDVIDNNIEIDELKQLVKKLHSRYLELSNTE